MFGWTAPCPLRLNGGAPEEGWTAQQFSRLAADLVAARRTLPFAILTVTRGTGGASPVLVKFSCMAPETEENTPTVTGNHSGAITITFPKAPTDFRDDPKTLNIVSLKVSRHESEETQLAAITAPHIVTVDPDDALAFDFTISIYAEWDTPKLGDYGGALDKENSETELVPYAWIWYQELGATLGSAFGAQTSGLVHARKAALARHLSCASRADERMRAQSTPGTSHPEILKTKWADALAVPVTSQDPEYAIRTRCEARFSTKAGQDIIEIQRANEELLGSRFVGVTVFDVDDPDGTWPDSYDLGPGLWASTRGKILVDVLTPLDDSDQEFKHLMNVQFPRMMSRITPAWVWYDWTSTDDGGFFLDVSPLDYTGL